MRRFSKNYLPFFSYKSYDDEQSSERHHEEYKIKYKIDPESGKMLSDQRFIRLGKGKLFDALDNSYMEDARDQILLYDTQEQVLYCFDIEDLFNDYVTEEEDFIIANDKTFSLTSLTKNIVLQKLD